uniref:RING-type domain-containing protein n=1 Tax=Glossina palpalis gambiensis TaxID=67801 RepID=A0A1B0BMB3_9MUSC
MSYDRYEILYLLRNAPAQTLDTNDHESGSSANNAFTECLNWARKHWRSVQIKKLSSYPYNSEIRRSDQTFCSVCLENFEFKQTVRKLGCSHEFHSQCVDKWLILKPTCPLCRAPL